MIKQIRYFQAVIRHNSFTKTAEECFISQSAISQQIQVLEQELGVKLLTRKNRRFYLTPAGQYFYQKSLVLIADYERMCRETARIANKDTAQLCIGCLKGYEGHEFRQAVAQFSGKHPEVSVRIISGSHEDLYNALVNGEVDVVLSDQRRAFSDEYINEILADKDCYVEVAAHSPLAVLKAVEIDDLKNIPCILVASLNQKENERDYYRKYIGIKSEFLFVENLEEARLLTISGKGFLFSEGGGNEPGFAGSLRRILLTRKGKTLKRKYCAFWSTANSGYYVEEFADILKSAFH